MNNIEAIRQFVVRTREDYEGAAIDTLSSNEARELMDMAKNDPLEAVALAYQFGQAVGERHGRRVNEVWAADLMQGTARLRDWLNSSVKLAVTTVDQLYHSIADQTVTDPPTGEGRE
ncbi:MAG: hypothetical protein LUE22_03100 [Oscillospiraceae bacterium]|nr:hypothetical protein [Oscillospiraceae bacterium]